MWSNDAENSALITGINNIFNIYEMNIENLSLNCNNSSTFDQISAALMSRRYVLQKHLKKIMPTQ